MYQLDIFADSEPVQRANDLIAALASFDRDASRLALLCLTQADPRNEGLPQFQQLCDFIDHWLEKYSSPDYVPTLADILDEEQLLREKIIPAAIVMGNAGGALLRKCWGELAKLSEGVGIGSECASNLAPELYLHAHQYADAVRTAQKVPGADMRAAVQRWLGLGYFGCGDVVQARHAMLRYAWIAPAQFESLVDEIGNAELAQDWSEFQADLGEFDASWFPAWCAYEKKHGEFKPEHIPTSDGGMAYRLVTNLAVRERAGLSPALLEDRTRLKQLNKDFFTFYMERRSDLYSENHS